MDSWLLKTLAKHTGVVWENVHYVDHSPRNLVDVIRLNDLDRIKLVFIVIHVLWNTRSKAILEEHEFNLSNTCKSVWPIFIDLQAL